MTNRKSKLNDFDKRLLAMGYVHGLSIQQLADINGISRRTVGRILEEMGQPLPMEKIRGEAFRVKNLLNKYDITYEQLEDILAEYSFNKTKEANSNKGFNRIAALFKPVKTANV